MRDAANCSVRHEPCSLTSAFPLTTHVSRRTPQSLICRVRSLRASPVNRAKRWILGIAIVLALLWFGLRPSFPDDGIPGAVMQSASEAKQVAIAMRLYADEHQGRLPSTLAELVPNYLPDDRFLARTHFATPRAVLADLPKEAIILFRVTIAPKRKQPYIVIARPDASVEWKKP